MVIHPLLLLKTTVFWTFKAKKNKTTKTIKNNIKAIKVTQNRVIGPITKTIGIKTFKHNTEGSYTLINFTTTRCLYSTFLVQGPLKALLQCKQLSLTATHTLTRSI